MAPAARRSRYAIASLGLLLLFVHGGQTETETSCNERKCDPYYGYRDKLQTQEGSCITSYCLSEEEKMMYWKMFDMKPAKDRPWLSYGYVTDPRYPFMHAVLVDDEANLTCEVATMLSAAPMKLTIDAAPQEPSIGEYTMDRIVFGNLSDVNADCLMIVKVKRQLTDAMHGQQITCKMHYNENSSNMALANVNDTYTHYAFRMKRPTVTRIGFPPWRSASIHGQTVQYECVSEDVTFNDEKDFKQGMMVNEGQYKLDIDVAKREYTTLSEGPPKRYRVKSKISFIVHAALREQFILACRARNSVMDPANPNVEVSYPYITDVGSIIIDQTDKYITIGASCGALSLVLAGALLYYYQSTHK